MCGLRWAALPKAKNQQGRLTHLVRVESAETDTLNVEYLVIGNSRFHHCQNRAEHPQQSHQTNLCLPHRIN
jgi:hypothetical protein